MGNDSKQVSGISVVCVYNDPKMREQCLDRSIAAYAGEVDVDYIPVDNTCHDFTSAGAALNHGAARARHHVVVFVHQDVYLHSIDRIATVGAELSGDRWGVLGANGVSSDGRSIGRMRDRVLVIGDTADTPVDVDSLDEVAFIVRRDRVLAHPLTEEAELAWHAYAVEYGIQMRRLGLGVGAVDLAVTHNSLTINLERLDVAHRRVASMYPDQGAIETTCGTIGPRSSRWTTALIIRDQRWRLRWLIRSVRAVQAARIFHGPVVLSDIRRDVDLLDFSDPGRLNVINVDRDGGFVSYAREPIQLDRAQGQAVVFEAVASVDELLVTVAALPTLESVLATNLSLDDLAQIDGNLPDHSDWIVGLQDRAIWLLGGPALRVLPEEWSQPQAVPLGRDRRARMKGLWRAGSIDAGRR